MAFTPRDRATIRAALLSSLVSRYSAAGKQLVTVKGSDAYMMADALAVQLEALESQANQIANEILPDRATTSFLERHGDVEGLTRDPATAATGTARVTGAATTLYNVSASQTLNSTDGFEYTVTPASFTTDGSGNYDVTVTSQTLGSDGNLATSQILTWSAAPSGLASTATVQTANAGEDAETDPDFATRVIARRQERPASGNRSDWKNWAEAVNGVEKAYIYPLSRDAGVTQNQLGCVSIILLGPPAGDSPVDTRFLVGDEVTNVLNYIEGDGDVEGNAVTGTQLRPATVTQTDYVVGIGNSVDVDIEVQVNVSSANAFTFAYDAGYQVLAAPTVNSFLLSGDLTTTIGTKKMLIPVGVANVRGSYMVAQASSVSYNGGTGKTTFSFATPLEFAPEAFGVVLPHCGNWSEIRTAIFDLIDSLGPGDVLTPGVSSRWPTEDVEGRATLYTSAITAAVMSASGVLSVSVIAPAGDEIPSPGELIKLDILKIKEL